MKNRNFFRFAAAVTVLLFSGNGIVLPEPSPFAPKPRPPVFDVASLKVPSEIASVQQTRKADSKRTVIYVQDAHGVLDAQVNIQKLIRYFEEEYGIRVFGLEGSRGDLDTLILKSFPDAFIKEKVLKQYLERGELTGADFAALTNPGEAVFHGLEDWPLYQANYIAYLEASESKERILKKLEEIRASLAEERKKIYSPEFNKFHENVELFEDEKTGLLELLKFLGALESDLPPQDRKISRSATPHLFNLMNAMFSSNNGAQEIQTEIAKVADKFQNIFRFKPELTQAQDFNTRYQGFRTGAEDPGAFLKYLVDLGKEIGYTPDLSFSLKQVLGDAETLSMIKGTMLYDEVGKVIRDYRSFYAKTDEQKVIMEKYQKLRVLKTMASLELIREQMDSFEKVPEDFLSILGDSQELMLPSLRFYDSALKRDQAFIDRINSIFTKEKTNVIVVLTGGFHSDGLERNLAKQNFNFAVLTPKMDSLNGQENYGKVMNGDLSYKEFLGRSFYDGFVRHSTLAMARELAKPDFMRTLKEWRDTVLRKLAEEGRLNESGEYNYYIDRLVSVYREKFGDADRVIKTEAEVLKDMESVLANFNDRIKNRIRSRFESQVEQIRQGLRSFTETNTVNAENISRLFAQMDAGKSGVNTILPLGNKESDTLTQFISGKLTLAQASQEVETSRTRAELRAADAESRLKRIIDNLRSQKAPAPVSLAGVPAELDPLPEESAIESKNDALYRALTANSSLPELIPEFKKIRITLRDSRDIVEGRVSLYFELLNNQGEPIKTEYRGVPVNAHIFIEGGLRDDSIHITATNVGVPGSRERALTAVELIRVTALYVAKKGLWKNLELQDLNPFSRKFFSENLPLLLKPGQISAIPEDATDYKIPFENMNLDEPVPTGRSEVRRISLQDRAESAKAALEVIFEMERSGDGTGVGPVSGRARQYLDLIRGANTDETLNRILPSIESWVREQRVKTRPRNIRDIVLFLSGSAEQQVVGLNQLVEWVAIDRATNKVKAGVEQNIEGIEGPLGLRLLDILTLNLDEDDSLPPADLLRVLRILDGIPSFQQAMAKEKDALINIARQIAEASFEDNSRAMALARSFSKLSFFREGFLKQKSLFQTMLKVPAQDTEIKLTASDVLANLDVTARSEVRVTAQAQAPQPEQSFGSFAELTRGVVTPEFEDLFVQGDGTTALDELRRAGLSVIDGALAQSLEDRSANVLRVLTQSGNVLGYVDTQTFKTTVLREYENTADILEIEGMVAQLQLTPFMSFSSAARVATNIPVDSGKIQAHRTFLRAYSTANLRKNETLVINLNEKSDVEPTAQALKELADPEVGVLGRLVVLYNANVPLKQKLWSFIPNRSFVPLKTGDETAAVADAARREKGLAGENIPIVLTSSMDLTKLTDPAVRDLLATLLSSLNTAEMKEALVETAVVIAMRVKQLSAEERDNFREDPKAFAGFLRKEGFADAIADSIGFGDKGFLQIRIEQFITAFRSEIRAAQSA